MMAGREHLPMGSNIEKMAGENRFIYAQRREIARFGTEQYRATGSKGVVLIRRRHPHDDVGEVNYLTVEQMRAYGLVGRGGPPIQQSVTAALNQYDPEAEVVVVFWYAEDATAYLLNIERDLLVDD